MVSQSESEVKIDTVEQKPYQSLEPKCVSVTAAEFHELLVSRSSLERIDIGDANLAGLHDKSTGRRFVVERRLLGVYR